MATKKSKKVQEPKPIVGASVSVETIPDLATYYVNHIEVGMTRHDIAMTVARLPAKLPPETLKVLQETMVLHVEPILQLIIPPTLLPGLIRAPTVQREQFEGIFGPIADEPPATGTTK